MSDSIPVTIHALRQDRFVNRFGDEIARLLNSEPKSARVHAYESRWGSINSDERRLQCSSRGGMVVFALGKLIERSGFSSLAFLGDLAHTHELIAQEDYGNEVFRFTVLNDLNEVAVSVRGFLAWIRAHPEEVSKEFWELGCDREQNYYETVDEVLEKVPPSMDPNNEVTDGDFWDLALAVSLLKTLQEIVDYALETNQRVVCEHWGGFESGSAGPGSRP